MNEQKHWYFNYLYYGLPHYKPSHMLSIINYEVINNATGIIAAVRVSIVAILFKNS